MKQNNCLGCLSPFVSTFPVSQSFVSRGKSTLKKKKMMQSGQFFLVKVLSLYKFMKNEKLFSGVSLGWLGFWLSMKLALLSVYKFVGTSDQSEILQK